MWVDKSCEKYSHLNHLNQEEPDLLCPQNACQAAFNKHLQLDQDEHLHLDQDEPDLAAAAPALPLIPPVPPVQVFPCKVQPHSC